MQIKASETSSRAAAMEALTDEQREEFFSRLGRLVYGSVPASAFARHKRPLFTIKDYLDIPKDVPKGAKIQTLAMEFWRDVARNELTKDLSEKWFGKPPVELAGECARSIDV